MKLICDSSEVLSDGDLKGLKKDPDRPLAVSGVVGVLSTPIRILSPPVPPPPPGSAFMGVVFVLDLDRVGSYAPSDENNLRKEFDRPLEVLGGFGSFSSSTETWSALSEYLEKSVPLSESVFSIFNALTLEFRDENRPPIKDPDRPLVGTSEFEFLGVSLFTLIEAMI
jgi:hypothetical protein